LATFKRLGSGNWRAQVRRKGRYVSQTFRRHSTAAAWALDTENRIDRGETLSRVPRMASDTFGQLIDLHLQDMKEVGKAPRRSKAATLDALKVQLGRVRLNELTRERLIQFGRDRARQGAGPVTVNIDFSYLKLVIYYAAAVHGVSVSPEPVELAHIALKRLGIIGKSRARERRPSAKELDRLIRYLDAQSAPAHSHGADRALRRRCGDAPGGDHPHTVGRHRRRRPHGHGPRPQGPEGQDRQPSEDAVAGRHRIRRLGVVVGFRPRGCRL